ncbi:MAG: hypothetical protein ACHQJ5_07455 [Vicinamibacteria bacterium]
MQAASPRTTVLASTLLAAALAAVYLVWAPSSQDLAAATFRADLFSDHGYAIWNNAWYSGHYLLSYSVLYPPLGALLGPRLTGAIAVVVAAPLFAILARRRFPDRALVPSLWFAAAIATWLLTGRIPFLLAVPFGLGALLAVDRSLAGATVLAAGASLASPVAGLFVALAGAAIALCGGRRQGLALAGGSLVPIALLNLAFPNGGFEPFVFSAFIAIPLLAVVVLWLVPAEYRTLRVGTVLYALLALLLFVIDNPLGGNVTRLGALFAGPVLALVLWPRGRWVVLAVSLPLLYWQLVAPVRDVRKAAGDRSTERAFYEPLLGELDRLAAGGESFRIEIPPTKNRWEAAYVARDYPIARGWLRQLESEDFDLFTDGELDRETYYAWLHDHAVSYVAVPDAPRDHLAEDEVALIDSGLDYLQPVWSGDDWRLYRVDGARAWGLEGLDVTVQGPEAFTVDAGELGPYPTSINWSRYWRVTEGNACVVDDDGKTTVVSKALQQRIEVGVGLIGDSC